VAKEPEQQASGTIPMAQAALLLMISDERVRQLQRGGYIPRAEKGRVPLVGAVQGYIRFLKDEERRSQRTAAESRVRDARAREIELRTARDEQELIPAEEAVAYAQEVFGQLVSRLNGLPAQFTRDLDERRRLEAAIDDIRTEVAAVIADHGPAYRGMSDEMTADTAE
jgi:hypothetical protein